MFEAALEAGFVAAGVNVMLIGPLPTPGIAYLTQALRVRLRRRHQRLAQPLRRQRHQVLRRRRRQALRRARGAHRAAARRAAGDAASRSKLGRATRVDKSRARYQEFCASTLPRAWTSTGMKIVIDCANGAGYKVGAAHPRGPRRRDRADRLLAERPQHQRWLRLDGAGAAAAHGSGRAGACRHRARWRRRPARDGRSPRPHSSTATSCSTSSRARASSEGRSSGPVVGTVMSNLGLEHRAARRRASSSIAPRSAIATCWRCCESTAACSAARPPATSCASTRRPPATG